MSEILLVNPRKRRKARRAKARKSTRRRRRAVARVAAPRRRRRRAVARRRNPAKRRASRRPAMGYVVGSRKIRRRKLNPSFRGITGNLKSTAMAGAVGAVGALGNDLLYGYVKTRLPAQLQTGWGRVAVKGLFAVLVGMVGAKVMRGKGQDLARGAMTVVLHEAFKGQLATMAPQLPLGEFDELSYVDPAQSVGSYVNGYISGDADDDYVQNEVLSGDASDILSDYEGESEG